MAGKKSRKVLLIVLGVFALGCVGIGAWLGPLVATAWRNGFLDPQLTSTYESDTEQNLKNIHQALMLYHDSEGQFPDSRGWMDAAWTRLQTADLSAEDEKKQLRAPVSASPEEFGYAMNDAASGKFKDDLKPDLPLVFDSKDMAWNAHGKPEALAPKPARSGGNKAITVDGRIVTLPEKP